MISVTNWLTATAAAVALGAFSVSPLAVARLPPPSPEQQKAEAEKKAAADAKAEQDKKQLAASMDRIAQRWRQRAESEGWPLHEPTSVAAVPAFAAEARNPTQVAPSEVPVRSEKRGTAPGSEDVKKNKPVEHGDRLPSAIYPDEKIEQEDRPVTKNPTTPK